MMGENTKVNVPVEMQTCKYCIKRFAMKNYADCLTCTQNETHSNNFVAYDVAMELASEREKNGNI